MREIMRVGHVFEEWASAHVDFEHFDEVWPYFLHDNFGSACASVVSPLDLASFAAEACLRIALRMNIPLRIDSDLPVPLFAECQNPIVGSGFRFVRIQRVPKPSDGISACADTSADEPFAASHGQPYCSLYGVYDDGQLEHIASRQTYSETLALANALAPGADFVASYAHRQRAMPRCKSGSDQRAKKRFRRVVKNS